jgi:hypothetical protein
MIKSIKTPRILTILAIGLIAFIAGCIAYSPREVNETIIISENGNIDAIYEGQFDNLEKFITSISKEKHDKFDINEYRRQSFQGLKDKDYLTEVYQVSPSIYHLKWHENFKIEKLYDSKLLSSFSNDEIPTILKMQQYSQLSDKSYIIYSDVKKHDDSEDADPKAKALIDYYINKFNAKVRIEVPANWILKHNATKVTDIGNGKKALEWSLDLKKAPEVELYLSPDPQDKKPFALMDAPKGSSCNGIVGENCKCGPFKLMRATGEIYANQAYELNHPHGVKKGCSDKDGHIDAVISDITGECTVKLLYDDESKKMCAVK